MDEDVKKIEEDRKRGSKIKFRLIKSRIEEDFDSKDLRREKDKLFFLKERLRLFVLRKYYFFKERKFLKKIEVIEKVEVKKEVFFELIEFEDKLDVEKKFGLFELGYKIFKKEVVVEDKDDLDER